MIHCATTLFVGVGSPCGDDRLGWIVADELARRDRRNIVVRKAAAPTDLFNWLTGVDRLVICDACQSRQPMGTILRFPWPNDMLARMSFSGTHDLSLPAALELAGRLAMLPEHTTIWSLTIEAPKTTPRFAHAIPGSPHPIDHLSPPIRAALPAFLDQLHQEILDA